MAAVVTALDTLDTELTADVVAFCPHPAWRHLMACGCYELIKGESPSRMGRLQLLDVTGRAGALACAAALRPPLRPCTTMRATTTAA